MKNLFISIALMFFLTSTMAQSFKTTLNALPSEQNVFVRITSDVFDFYNAVQISDSWKFSTSTLFEAYEGDIKFVEASFFIDPKTGNLIIRIDYINLLGQLTDAYYIFNKNENDESFFVKAL